MTADLPTMYWRWDGRAMLPLNPARAAQSFTIGENYRLEVREERSEASHAHYFAVVKEAFDNLPDSFSERFPTADHLRRWCLIKTGFRDERTHICESPAKARDLAAFIKPIDDYAVVVARDNIVVVWTAKSQSVRSMGKAEFQRSKDAVLGELAKLVGTEPETLRANAGRAA